MTRLLVPFADQHVEIPSITAGNIALTVGLKQVEHHTFIHHIPYLVFWRLSPQKSFPLSLKTVTGDTIVSSKASAAAAARRAQNDGGARKKRGEDANVVLSGVEVPDPVFFCTIEPPTMSKQAGQLTVIIALLHMLLKACGDSHIVIFFPERSWECTQLPPERRPQS